MPLAHTLAHASPALPPVCTAGEAAAKVTDIFGVRGMHGGKHVVDRFEIRSTEVVERLVSAFNKSGYGSLNLKKMNTAVMLVPPLVVSFRTQRIEGVDARQYPTELRLTGHFMMLVDRKAMRKDPLWKFDEERAHYPAENKLAYKIAVAAALRALGKDIVPQHLLDFVRIL